MAASKYFDTIQQVYTAFYQRPADPAGLYYWAQRVDLAGGDMTSVINAFATSEEAVRLYNTIDATTIGTVIDKVYLALFNRAPDETGKKFYVDGFTAGTFTPGTIVLNILDGARNNDAVAIQNKLEAANLFTKTLDPEQDGIGPFTATYNATDEGAARTWLAGVTSDPVTRKTQTQVTAEIQANIANAGDSILDQVSGKTFTLTTSVDNFTGTTGNDTFIADNTGTNTTGLADVLAGGAGTDSLTIYGFATGDGVPQMSAIENVILDNSAAGSTISLVNATGLSSVTVQNAVGATDTTVGSGVAVTLKTNAAATTAQVVNYGATATSASLVLNGVTTNTTVDVQAIGAAVTTLNIATTGAASTVGQLEVDAAMATVVVTGAQNLTITDAVEEAVEVINASAFTGKLSVATADQVTTPDALVATVDVTDITVTGGSGDDTINIAANAADNEVSVNAGAGNDKVVIATGIAFTAGTSILAGDSIVGGDGTDTLSINGNVSAADLSALITGFETLEFTADANGTAMTTNKLGITNFLLTGADTDVVLTGVGANATVKITEANDSDITATIAVDTTADVINVNMESAGATSGSTITLSNYDTLNLSSTKATADAATVANTVAAIAATSVSALNISGTQGLTITTAALKASATVTSASTGAVTSTFTTSLLSYTGGTGVDTLTLAAGNLAQGSTFAGGTGTDVLNATVSASQDLGIVGLTGFETLNLTTSGANVGDFRNVTDLATISVTAGAGTDDLTLNRLSADTTLSFATSIDQVVTTINTGTTQKVAASAAATITSLTLDSGTTSLTITSDDGDATADEAMSDFTAISGTSLASIIVKGADQTVLNTLSTTVTSVDASTATGGLTVTASATATSIIGSQAADAITGGGAADTITGGKGADTLVGGAGADKYVFAATGALNGADVFAANIVGGAGGDILNFAAFLSGGSLLSATPTESNGAADVNFTGKVVLLANAVNGAVAAVDTAAEVAALIQGAANALALTSGGKGIIIAGDDSAATAGATIYFVDDTLDGTSGTVSATDVVIVGTATLDIDTLLAANNFAFA